MDYPDAQALALENAPFPHETGRGPTRPDPRKSHTLRKQSWAPQPSRIQSLKKNKAITTPKTPKREPSPLALQIVSPTQAHGLPSDTRTDKHYDYDLPNHLTGTFVNKMKGAERRLHTLGLLLAEPVPVV